MELAIYHIKLANICTNQLIQPIKALVLQLDQLLLLGIHVERLMGVELAVERLLILIFIVFRIKHVVDTLQIRAV